MEAQALQQLYYQMLRIRMVEEKIAELYPGQEIRCPVHLSTGEESVAVGVCAGLSSEDYVLSNHRSHAHYLAKGGNLRAMFAELYGKVTGCSMGKGGSMHLVDLSAGFLGAVPVVANTIPLAVGAAFTSKQKNQERTIVVFLGEGATEEGAFHESMNFAALHSLPVIFVCENNLYSVYSPLNVRQSKARDNCVIARGYGMESFRDNGNNILAVLELAERAIQKARNGEGPTFVEFSTYRWREHCGPNYDNNLGYRAEHEFLEWKQRCPVISFEQRLRRDGLLSDAEICQIKERIGTEIEDAVAFAKSSPWPDENLLLAHIYAERRIDGVAT